jgi:hypothetical protein
MLAGAELVVVASGRRAAALARPESIALTGTLAGYAAYVVGASGYLEMVRTLFPSYNAAYSTRLTAVASSSPPWLMNLAVWVAFALGLALGWRTAVGYFAALAGAVASALVQQKGWSYHWMPAQLVAGYGVLALLGGLAQRATERGARLAARALAGVIVVGTFALVGTRMTAMRARPPSEDGPAIVRWIDTYAQGRRVLTLTSSCGPVFPALASTEAHLTGFGAVMLLPGLYREAPRAPAPFPYHAPEAMPALERVYLDSIERAFERDDPNLILVHTVVDKQGFGPTSFDFLEHLRLDPRLARRLEGYAETVRNERWLVLTRRAGLPSH